jgi:hypothetical protein
MTSNKALMALKNWRETWTLNSWTPCVHQQFFRELIRCTAAVARSRLELSPFDLRHEQLRHEQLLPRKHGCEKSWQTKRAARNLESNIEKQSNESGKRCMVVSLHWTTPPKKLLSSNCVLLISVMLSKKSSVWFTNRTHRTVVPSRENHRRPHQKRYFTLILGKTRVQHEHQIGIQWELEDAPSKFQLQTPTWTSSLSLSLHQPNQAQQMRFTHVNKTVCLLECAALTSQEHIQNNGEK